jgi:hypothetical protein
MRAFAAYWFLNTDPDETAVAYAVYDTVRGVCEALLPDAFTLKLERARVDWRACWDFMGAQGDFQSSLREWDTRYNARMPDHEIQRTETGSPNDE